MNLYWLFWLKHCMFASMKKLFLLVSVLIGSTQIFAQENGIIHAAMKMEEFVKVPALPNKPQNPAFTIMREPVLAVDFQEFITYLYSQNNLVDANTCVASVSKDLNINTKYVVLNNPAPIALYAAYLSKRMSTKTKKVTYALVSEKQWKQAKGMPDTYDVPKRNSYGLIFQQGIFEWKTTKNGNAETFVDTNGYKRSSFRLTYSEKPINTGKKK